MRDLPSQFLREIYHGAITHAKCVTLTLWQGERHFCHLRFTGAATILSFGHSMFTSLDSIGSAVVKRPIEHAIASSEWPTEY